MSCGRIPLTALATLAFALGTSAIAAAQESPAGGDDSDRFWGAGEYLLHWIADAPVDPLLTVGPAVGGEVIGDTSPPGDEVLIGDRDLDYGAFSGGRLAFGGWVDASRSWGLEAGGLFLDDQRVSESASSTGGAPYLAVPLAINGVGQALALSFTNLLGAGPHDGSFALESSSDLWGVDLGAWWNLDRKADSSWDLLVGVRNLALEEEIDLRYAVSEDPPGPVIRVLAHDEFEVDSRFYGLQLGTRFALERDPWTLTVAGRVALGAMVRDVRIDGEGGAFVEGDPDYPAATGYGVFALPGNIGNHSDAVFSVMPEFRLAFGYQATRGLRFTVGYDFLYVSGAARAADQIDTDVRTSGAIPAGFTRTLDDYLRFIGPTGTTDAGEDVRGSGFWAHGLNVGLELSF